MHRRLTLSLAMAAIGVGMLVASSFAGAASASSPQRAGSGRRSAAARCASTSRPPTSSSRPRARLRRDRLAGALRDNMMLLNYPDKPAPEGSRLVPDAATGSRACRATARRTRSRSGGPQVQRRLARDRRGVQARDRARGGPAAGSPAIAFMHDVVGADTRNEGKARAVRASRRRARCSTIRLQAGEPDVPGRDRDAVLRRGQADDGDRREGDQRLSRPPARTGSSAARSAAGRPGAEHLLQGHPTGEPGPDRDTRRTRTRTRACSRFAPARWTTTPRPPADGTRRPLTASTASRRAAPAVTSSTRASARLPGAEHVAGRRSARSTSARRSTSRSTGPAMVRVCRQVRRQADRPDPAAEHAGLPRSEAVSDQGRGPCGGRAAERGEGRRSRSSTRPAALSHRAGQILKFNLEQIGLQRDDEAAAVRRRTSHGRHPRLRLRRF